MSPFAPEKFEWWAFDSTTAAAHRAKGCPFNKKPVFLKLESEVMPMIV